MVAEILSYDSINEGVDQYTRLMLGSAEDEIKFDSQGRFVIPQKMREVAKLTDKAMLVGCGNRMEIWSKAEYEEYSKSPDAYGVARRQTIAKAYRQMKGLEG
jgi:MraZ protein